MSSRDLNKNVLNKENILKKEYILKEELNNLKIKAKNEKWFINYSELDIKKPYLAKGSNSIIYNCLWRETDIVVKTINKYDFEIYKDLLREIELFSTIKHPNTVQFLGVSVDYHKNLVYLLMEKIEGETLKHKLIFNKLKNKYKIIKQLIKTINFLHKCNPPIIFRDLKPENIMIDNHGNLKLIDFGLARYMPNNDNYKLTGNTGNDRYMSPEVFFNKNYNLKADIYSLGLIIYYILTNNQPFIGYSRENLSYFLNNKTEFNLDLVKDKSTKNIIQKCIKKDQNYRCDINFLIENINIFKKKEIKFNFFRHFYF